MLRNVAGEPDSSRGQPFLIRHGLLLPSQAVSFSLLREASVLDIRWGLHFLDAGLITKGTKKWTTHLVVRPCHQSASLFRVVLSPHQQHQHYGRIWKKHTFLGPISALLKDSLWGWGPVFSVLTSLRDSDKMLRVENHCVYEIWHQNFHPEIVIKIKAWQIFYTFIFPLSKVCQLYFQINLTFFF